MSASYSAALLEALKSKRNDCSNRLPSGPSRITPAPLRVFVVGPSMWRFHTGMDLSKGFDGGSAGVSRFMGFRVGRAIGISSGRVNSPIKSATAWPFITLRRR